MEERSETVMSLKEHASNSRMRAITPSDQPKVAEEQRQWHEPCKPLLRLREVLDWLNHDFCLGMTRYELELLERDKVIRPFRKYPGAKALYLKSQLEQMLLKRCGKEIGF